MATQKVALGSKAYSFHDQALGITIVKGEVIELTSRQLQCKNIKNALNGGHLRFVNEPVDKYSKDDLDRLDNKLIKALKKGTTVDKVAKDFSLEETKLLASRHEIEVEASDTTDTIISAIAETLEEK